VLHALIVDDEPPARAELVWQLKAFPDVVVVGEAGSLREAEAILGRVHCDVLFLDIQLPGRSGLEFAADLHGGELRTPFVVLVTAHDEHALRAYGLSVVDYLVKPVEEERLARTVARLRTLKSLTEVPRGGERARPRLLTGFDGERAVPVPLAEISYLRADGERVVLVRRDGKELVLRGTLQTLERVLPPERFVRCHRSFLVNVLEVGEIVPFFGRSLLLRMKETGAEVPVSRARAALVKQLFGFD
jgi:DNA-binding LytR/AlgR family response regulator